jgi:hypothetical protein
VDLIHHDQNAPVSPSIFERRVKDDGMAKRHEPVDELLDALVWMRRKAKKRQPVDDLIDALMSMRRKAKKKGAKSKRTKSPRR